MWSLGSGRCRRPGEGYPLCQRSCRLDRIGPFWTRTLGIGSIRTGVQGSDRGATFAAGEFVGGAGISRGWTEWSDAGALVSGRVGRDLAIGLEAASAGRRTRSKAPPKVTVPRTWPSQQRDGGTRQPPTVIAVRCPHICRAMIWIYAGTSKEIETRPKSFTRKWRLKCRAVADSLKTQTMLPSAETAAMLLWALLASGQNTMRKVDGWQTLAERPTIQCIDLAARRDNVTPPETTAASISTNSATQWPSSRLFTDGLAHQRYGGECE